MKRLVKLVSLPLVLLVGLALIGPQTAEGARRHRYARHAYVPHRYVAPAVVHAPAVRVYAPPVRVYAPGVGVQVGPGVHVRAPGVRVNVGPRYPYYYGSSYYFGW